ncbi:MAG: DUF1501 domain-containing protein [Candidatus Omnitrophica bacterium]|nr:DUF1501 domain-containing protein [Candidatus Omnitrophota bacterium]MCA9443562.1 DUF1501 domain-containing protein [Candidatus Omnitrophota bacterium]
MDRRHFLKHLSAAAAGGLCTPSFHRMFAWAQQGQDNPHFFMFVFAQGGWDITQVFESDKEGLQTVDVPTGQRTQFGSNVTDTFWNDPMGRPAVTQFFQNFGDRTAILNGVFVRTLSHDLGRETVMTGSTGMNKADWPTQIAARKASDRLLPNLSLSGPNFPGNLGGVTTSGNTFNRLLFPSGYSPDTEVENRMESYLNEKLNGLLGEAMEMGHEGGRVEELDRGYLRFNEIKEARNTLNLGGGGGFTNQGLSAVGAFQNGISVTATLRAPGGYDTHGDNDAQQGNNFQNTFMGLNQIVTELANRPGTTGTGSLLDQTTVCLMSEFGRTPRLNGGNGKDHWPVTSMMFVGAGINGGKVFGGTDERQNYRNVDYSTGLPDDSSSIELATPNIGAALLTLAGLDANEILPGEPVFSPLLDMGA